MYYEEDYKFSNIILAISTTIMFSFIALFCFVFIGLSKVEAVTNDIKFPFQYEDIDITTTSRGNLGIVGTSRGYMYNCSSSSTCNSETSQVNVGNGFIWKYGTKMTNDTSGFRWDFLTNETLYKNKLYAINSYFCATDSFTPSFDSWTGINQGSEMIKSTLYYNNYKSEPNILFSSSEGNYSNCLSAYQVFKPNNNSMYYGLQVKTSSGSVQSNYVFLGYNLSVLGEVNDLSSSDIQSIVNNSVGSSTTTITNNIDEMNENITNEINEMTEEQKQNTQDIIDNQNKNNEEMKDTINDNLNTCRPSKNLINLGTNMNGYVEISSKSLITSPSSISYYFETNKLPDTITINSSNGNRSNYSYWNNIPNYGSLADYVPSGNYQTKPRTINIDKNYNYIYIQFSYNFADVNEIMVNEGTSALAYEESGVEICKNKLDETNDYLTDDTPPSSDISGLGNIEGLLPPGPLDTLLNIPIQFLSSFITGLNETCTPLRINFFWDMPIEFPCFSTAFYSRLSGPLEYAINLIPGVLILIKYFKYLYSKVERATSFNTNADDMWGAI